MSRFGGSLVKCFTFNPDPSSTPKERRLNQTLHRSHGSLQFSTLPRHPWIRRLRERQRLLATLFQRQAVIAGPQLDYQFFDALDSLSRLRDLPLGLLATNHAAVGLL
jgi:hypothetical protein